MSDLDRCSCGRVLEPVSAGTSDAMPFFACPACDRPVRVRWVYDSSAVPPLAARVGLGFAKLLRTQPDQPRFPFQSGGRGSASQG